MTKTGKRDANVVVVSAYDLIEGDAVYLAHGTAWARQIKDARVFDSESAAAPVLSHVLTRQNEVIGAHLMSAAIGPDGTPEPVHFREAFRATGPSDRFIGKQAAMAKEEHADVRL